MNKLLLILALPIFSFAQTPAKTFQLNGHLKLDRPASWAYLRYVGATQSVYDSVEVKNGTFNFSGKIAEPTVASLMVKYANPAEGKPPRDVVTIWLEPATLDFSANGSLDHHSLKGASGYADFSALQQKQEVYDSRFQHLYQQYDSLEKAGDKKGTARVEKEINELSAQMKEDVYVSFLKNHPDSKVALYALKQYAGWDIDPVKVEPLFNLLAASTKTWPSAIALKQRIEIAKAIGIGSYAPDFTQKDTLGNPVSLSSFRGKYVLLDFWASWCGPCRRENPNVVKAFNDYKDKNFTVLSVSLDQPNAKEKWLTAIHKDGLTWTHVSDLKYWDNAVAKQYGIRAIPQNLLIDPQGKIVAKNLRGPALQAKLAELMN